jgi:hypothetical protein
MKRIVVVCVAVFALGACSSDGSDSNASSTSTSTTTRPAAQAADSAACRLIGADDATEFLGGPASQLQSAAAADESSACIWTADSADNLGQLLQIRVFDDEAHYGIKQFETAKPIPGLGDKAFVSVGPAGSSVDVQFVKGGKTYTVHYSIANVVNTDQGGSVDRSDDLVAMIKANSSRV